MVHSSWMEEACNQVGLGLFAPGLDGVVRLYGQEAVRGPLCPAFRVLGPDGRFGRPSSPTTASVSMANRYDPLG